MKVNAALATFKNVHFLSRWWDLNIRRRRRRRRGGVGRERERKDKDQTSNKQSAI